MKSMARCIGSAKGDTAPARIGATAIRHTTVQSPRRPRAFLGALVPGILALLVMLGSVAALDRAIVPATGPIYSLSAVRAAFAHGQTEFLDRPLRVRAVVGVCTIRVSECFDWQPVMVDDWRGGADGALPVEWTPILLTSLRRLPLLGRLLPAPQPVQWGMSAVYRVAFHVADGAACGLWPCLQADLLDAAPPTE